MLYFDHAATSWPKPGCVIDACMEAMHCAGNPGRGAHDMALWSSRMMYKARTATAGLFGCQPQQVVFTQNATMAINEAIAQIGGEILTTAMEHNSVLRPCHLRGNYRVVDIPEGELKPKQIIEAIGVDTKAVIMTHASNLTGEIYNIQMVGRFCRNNDLLFIVDAAQTAGIVPINIEEMCIDLLCFSGHKGTLGPTGTGGLIVGDRVHPRPFLCGGTGSQSHELDQPLQMPDVLEAGTQNIHGIAGLCAGIEYVMEIGVENILAHEQALAAAFINGVKDIPGITIYRPECRRVGTVALNMAGWSASDVCDELAQAGVCVRGGAHCAPLAHEAIGTRQRGAVRFSFGWSNTMDEVLDGVEILKRLFYEVSFYE